MKCPTCGTDIEHGNGNCSLVLSYLKGWKNKPGCVSGCRCGYPIRAKEIRKHIFRSFIDNDRTSNKVAYCYCELRNGIGHVYQGTFNRCFVGNGLCADELSSCVIFERYANAQ